MLKKLFRRIQVSLNGVLTKAILTADRIARHGMVVRCVVSSKWSSMRGGLHFKGDRLQDFFRQQQCDQKKAAKCL